MKNFNRLWIALFVVVIGSSVGTPAFAQEGSRAVPREDYYRSFQAYHDGEYEDALKMYRSAARGGIRSTLGRWVDSICYATMMGECYYQMGEHGLALEQYDAALKLYLAHQNWMLRIDFPPTLQASASTRARTIQWGAPKRQISLGRFPDTMLSFQGRTDNEQVLQNGGIVSNPKYYPLRVTEIVRCIAVALRRRAEIMGPIGKHDPTTSELITAFSRRSAPPNHWSQAWASAHLGLAYLAAGRTKEAQSEMSKGVLVLGQFDHPMTPILLLELGKISLGEGQHDAAAISLMEATYSAALYSQFDVMREAFSISYLNRQASGKLGIFAPLAPAAAWSRRESSHLHAGLSLTMAENMIDIGDAKGALGMLEQARRAMIRKDMLVGKLGGKLAYLTAAANYSLGKVPLGDRALADAMKFQSGGSLWLYQITLADKLFISGALTERVAMEVFDELLREPENADWIYRPEESLAVISTPHELPMEHWFEIAIARKEAERALEISEQIKRHRFTATLPMGGRLLALRWLLEAPDAALTKTARLQRQDLLLKYPAYIALNKRAAALQTELRLLPVVPQETADVVKQSKLLSELGSVSAAQEAALRRIAVDRQPAEQLFPPKRTFKEMQDALPPGQMVIDFFSTKRYTYVFAFSDEKYGNWKVDSPAKVYRELQGFLQQIGHIDKNQAVKAADLADDTWQQTARSLMTQLIPTVRTETWNSFETLVVIPDGALWYLPFEVLQVAETGGTVPLMSKVQIRYAPMASLASPDGRGRKAGIRSGMVAGPLFPRADNATVAATVEEFSDAIPGLSRLPLKLPSPSSLYATTMDQLIVMQDSEVTGRGSYSWGPMLIDQGRPGSSLMDWMSAPWNGPVQVVVPGFHTPAEYGLKRGGDGSDLFLSTCGLMASGSKTVLISRWRVGGQSSRDLVREFVKELPNTTAANAWQRSVELLANAPIDPDLEPRLTISSRDDEVDASHPFFWSGYLLIDDGNLP
jgi:tetratricopeptide (TPR) repeat protein